MKYDRIVDQPSNARRASARHLDNVYVGLRLLQEREGSEVKWSRFSSAASEDAVTWNVLVGLLGDCDLVIPGAVQNLPGGELLMRDSTMLLWNAPVGSDPALARLQRVLVETQSRIEANPRTLSEIEAVLWNERQNRLTVLEAKLTSGPGACSAVSSSPGIRKSDADCRMFRTSKRPRDNGCSYWGIGAGGTAFSRRFSRDYVRAHLRFEPPRPGHEEQAPCARLYQLMRNVLIGREMADALEAQSGDNINFHFIAIVAQGYFDSTPYLEFAKAIKDRNRVGFGVITWQGIRDVLHQGRCQPDVATYLDNHTYL